MKSSKYNFRWKSVDAGLAEMGMLDSGVVFNNDTVGWKLHRRLLKSGLQGQAFLNKVAVISCRQADKLRNKFVPSEEHATPNMEIDVAKWFKLFSLDTIGIIAFDKDFGALDEGETHEMTKGVVDMFKAWKHFLLTPFIVWKYLMWNASSSHIAKLAHFRNIERSIIQAARNKLHTAKSNRKIANAALMDDLEEDESADLNNFPCRLVLFQEQALRCGEMNRGYEQNNINGASAAKPSMQSAACTTSSDARMTSLTHTTVSPSAVHGTSKMAPTQTALSEDDLCQSIREMIMGGTDTTSNLLAFIFFYLAKFPLEAAKVRNEIISIVPSSFEDPEFLSRITIDKQMPRTEAFIKEVSRLHSAVPLILRHASEDDIVGGHLIPKGTNIVLNCAASAVDPEAVTEPWLFSPDRWQDSSPSSELSKAVYPFGYGARNCPGQYVAMIEMKSVLARILPHISIHLRELGDELETEFDIVNHPKHDTLVLKISALCTH
ncbi:hypothetical protein CYMTET_55693 [Cymbomonas tetramitiformis]|uniref:Cytochrome P450 n=1 Tax=Cymbomonas tetramitiformis TaxID=36881 RepID=A0AAE0BDP0_9CHLO|nr:hypothetical protein CYMTET_55693 [Cymbomonas tetramitiformis]